MRKSAALSSALLALALTLAVFSRVPASAAGNPVASTASVASRAEGAAPQLHAATLSPDQMASAPSVSASGANVETLVGGPWSDPAPAWFASDQPNTAPHCGPGYACMKIKAGSQPWYYDFWYFDYGVYALEDWVGHGYLNNRQTGGATLRTYNASGGLIDCYPSNPDAAISNPDWTPVYYIELSPAGC